YSTLSSLLHSLILPPSRRTLFPYTTLFRSPRARRRAGRSAAPRTTRNRAGYGRRKPDGSHRSSRWARPDRRGRARFFRGTRRRRSEEHTSELQSRENLVCRLLLEKKKQ